VHRSSSFRVENAATYLFNKHVIQHHFCKVCGIHPYGEATDPKGVAMAAVNIRCLEGIDLDSVPVRKFDGRSSVDRSIWVSIPITAAADVRDRRPGSCERRAGEPRVDGADVRRARASRS